MSETDEDLIHQIAQTQPGALALLYDQYSRLVFSLAMRITSSAGAAEEITQDVFLQVWRNAAAYNPALGKVSTWLTSITRYRSIDVLRRQTARVDGRLLYDDLEEMDIANPQEDRPENLMESNTDEQRVRHALAELPDEQRQVLLLAYFKGQSQVEIAAALDQPLGTVKTRVRLGLQKLRRLLTEPENTLQ